MNVTENFSGHDPEEVFSLAARENNLKRGGLIVNSFQAKHVPARPSDTLEMFDRLADRIPKDKRKTMVIGFAETATAIGARLAAKLGGGCFYIHTTREKFPESMNIALFNEEHSHATEQQLISDKGTGIFDGVERIIFAEDELTTGKTILNFINALNSLKGIINCSFGAASVINGMSEDNLARFKEKGVSLYWLIKIDSSAETLKSGMTAIPEADNIPRMRALEKENIITLPKGHDPRLGVKAREYDDYCRNAARLVCQKVKNRLTGNRVEVIGTEECMYPAIITAMELEETGFEVCCHSATRSPIVPSKQQGYPLFSRYRLSSFYDRERQTFLYNITDCENAIVMTDGDISENELYSALDNKNIIGVQL